MKIVSRILSCSLLCALLWFMVAAAHGQTTRIVSAEARAKLIALGKTVTDRYDVDFASTLADLPYPFELEEVPEPVVASTTDGEATTPAAPVVEEVTAQQILDAFIATHSVSGRMRMGDTDYLLIIYPDGRTRKQSEDNKPLPIRFPFEGKAYAIYVGDVTDDHYTFKIGDATYRGTFNKSLEDASIQRFQPNSQ